MSSMILMIFFLRAYQGFLVLFLSEEDENFFSLDCICFVRLDWKVMSIGNNVFNVMSVVIIVGLPLYMSEDKRQTGVVCTCTSSIIK